MKILLSLILIFVNLFGINSSNLIAYNGDIEHLFTHCLIAYPEIAFDKNNSMSKHYANDCITKYEFKNIIESLYENNYILVDINDTFEIKENKAIKKTLYLPKNKKPLILSFDDVNYDRKKLGKGMVDKIILDKNNNIATETNFNGKKEIKYDNEFIPILESFIKKHKDFSFNGARATLNLTGYDGILGYRTNSGNKSNRKNEIESAKKVVKRLKDLGYTFASHSYGHYHMKKITNDHFRNELELWKNEVASIVGDTQIYVYPYGEWEIEHDGGISEKHKLLNEYGFKLFCGVGIKPFFSYLPFNKNIKEKSLFMDRKPIDGFTIKNRATELEYLFNCSKIIDSLRLV